MSFRASSTVISVFSRLFFSSHPRRTRQSRGSDSAVVRRTTGWSGARSSVAGGGGAPKSPASAGASASRNRAIFQASVAFPTPFGPEISHA